MADDLSRVTIAKPIYGTTRTHYTVLWHLLGRDGVTEWHQEVLNRNVKVANGNAQVKDLVASGSCDLGWTDTDDFFVAKDEGKPVAMLPIRVGDAGKTILIPNSVCLIKGAKHPEAARKFIDFLLSQESEVALSKSAARQIPLGPVPEELLSPEVRQLREWGQDGYDMTVLGEATAECLAWLRAEYLK
jgi:iron(III) transport system substrate-binding protein